MPQRVISRVGSDVDQSRPEAIMTAACIRFERRMYAAFALSTAITIGALGLIIALS